MINSAVAPANAAIAIAIIGPMTRMAQLTLLSAGSHAAICWPVNGLNLKETNNIEVAAP